MSPNVASVHDEQTMKRACNHESEWILHYLENLPPQTMFQLCYYIPLVYRVQQEIIVIACPLLLLPISVEL